MSLLIFLNKFTFILKINQLLMEFRALLLYIFAFSLLGIPLLGRIIHFQVVTLAKSN